MILFMDRFLMALSDRVTVIPFLEENYIYYKIPPMLGLFGVVIMVTLFKNTIYNYESENERIKEKLHIKNDELEKIVNERTQALKQSTDRVINMAFITSHEIRGPLASILSITELLQKQPDDEQIKEMIPRLHERSMQMDDVIKKMNKALSEEASTEER